MTADVLVRGARGGGATTLGQLARLAVQLVSVVVLSRMLTPTDFGLVAMLAVFLALGDLLRDFGMPMAALQARTLSHQQASNAFWVNTGLGAGTALLVAAAAPVLVRLYDEPRLAALAPVMASTLLLNGVQAQVQVQLARSMRFTALAVTDVGSQLLGFAVAVTGALAGWGYWSLVAQSVTAALTLMVTRTAVARWRPSAPRDLAGTRAVFRAGGHFGAAQLLTFAAGNADTLLIGARWGATELGFYSRAFQILSVPMTRLIGSLTHVVVPTVNAVREQQRDPAAVLLRVQLLVGGMAVWTFATSAAVAEQLVPWVLGDQWGPTGHLFQVLAIGGCVQGLSYVSYWIFIVEEQSRELLRYNLVTKVAAVGLVVGGSFVSVEAVAWAYSIGLVVSWPIGLAWLGRATDLPMGRFLRNGSRLLLGGVAGFLAAHGVERLLTGAAPVVQVAVGVLVSAVAFVVVVGATRAGRGEITWALRAVRTMLAREGR